MYKTPIFLAKYAKKSDKTLFDWVRLPPLWSKKIWVFSDKDFLDCQRPLSPLLTKSKKIPFFMPPLSKKGFYSPHEKQEKPPNCPTFPLHIPWSKLICLCLQATTGVQMSQSEPEVTVSISRHHIWESYYFVCLQDRIPRDPRLRKWKPLPKYNWYLKTFAAEEGLE